MGRFASGRSETDEALVLEAIRRARFLIISSVRRHTVAGLIVKDLFRGFEFWLVDEGGTSLPDGAVLATRPPSPEPSSDAAIRTS